MLGSQPLHCGRHMIACDLLEMRPRPRQIAGDFNIQLLRAARLGIEQVDVSSLLIHNRVRTRRRVHDVEVVVMTKLDHLFRIGAVRIQIDGVIAVREEIDGVADPHWLRVNAVVPWQLLDRCIGQSQDSDGMRPAASVVTPLTGFVPSRSERGSDFIVSKAPTVWRICTAPSARKRQRLRESAV